MNTLNRDASIFTMTLLSAKDFASLSLATKRWRQISKAIPRHFIQYRTMLLQLLEEELTEDERALTLHFLKEFRCQFFALTNNENNRAQRLLATVHQNTKQVIDLNYLQLAKLHFVFLFKIDDISYPCLSAMRFMSRVSKAPVQAIAPEDQAMVNRIEEALYEITEKNLSVSQQLDEIRFLIARYLREICRDPTAMIPALIEYNSCPYAKYKLLELARYINKGRALKGEELKDLWAVDEQSAPKNALLVMGSGLTRLSEEEFRNQCLNSIREIDQNIAKLTELLTNKKAPKKVVTVFLNIYGQSVTLEKKSIHEQLNELLAFRATALVAAANSGVVMAKENIEHFKEYRKSITKNVSVLVKLSILSTKKFNEITKAAAAEIKKSDLDCPASQPYIEPFTLLPMEDAPQLGTLAKHK
jgi:hypothetical protein